MNMVTGRRWGQDSCWLHVETSNTQALMLYEAAGFQQVASVRRPNDMFQKCYLLMRPLPQPPAPRLDPSEIAPMHVHFWSYSTRLSTWSCSAS